MFFKCKLFLQDIQHWMIAVEKFNLSLQFRRFKLPNKKNESYKLQDVTLIP